MYLTGNAFAVDWVGLGEDDYWNTADNWSTNIVPESVDPVLIGSLFENDFYAVVADPATAYNLRVGGDSVLDVFSTITLSQNLFWGTHPKIGTINVNAGGTIEVPGFVDANAGTLNINSGGSVNVAGFNPTTAESLYLSYGGPQTSAISINGGTLDAPGNFLIGAGGTGTLALHGGTLNSDFGSLLLGVFGGGFANGTMEISDGTATFAGQIVVGNEGVGTLSMTGGSLTTNSTLFLSYHPSATGNINLMGGTLTAAAFAIGPAGGTGMMDITNGTLVIDGDQTSLIAGYVTSGEIVGFGGSGAVEYTFDGSSTIVTAVASSMLAGDFDEDGDVDGRDFLLWQRGGSPNPLSHSDLVDWESNYGVDLLVSSIRSVPEPSSLVAVFGALLLTWPLRYRSRYWHWDHEGKR
jgi:hypothetical protein